MTESRQEFLARVAAEHDAWVQQNLAGATFDPASRPDSGDYNMWYVDMEATPEQLDALAEAIGPVPEFAPDDDIPETDEEDSDDDSGPA